MNALIDLRLAMEANGLPAPETLIADGLIHNYGPDAKPADGPFWYCLVGSQVQMCTFGNANTMRSYLWFSHDMSSKSEAVRDQLMSAIKQSQQAMQRQFQFKMNQERDYANHLFGCAEATQNHPYLDRHQVKSFGLRLDGEFLLVPMRDVDRKLRSVQRISNDGQKEILLADFKLGCYFSIGKQSDTLVICVDYVTAASIHMATGWLTAAALYSDNLPAVALGLRKKMPEQRILIAGDDVRNIAENSGLIAARQAADLIGVPCVIPKVENNRPGQASNFNDLHTLLGLEVVRSQLLQAVEAKHAE